MTAPSPPSSDPNSPPEARRHGTPDGPGDSDRPTASPDPATDEATAPYNAAGEKRPAFLKDLPSDPTVQRLARLFEAGDYYLMRKEARDLLSSEPSPTQAAAARELLARTQASRPLRWMLGACAALFLVVVAWVYTHNP